MFYDPRHQDPKIDCGLPHSPWKALVQPRPVAWISTQSKDGRDNLAPYSFFNAIASDPPMVMYANNGDNKDTLRNILDTKAFVINLAADHLLEKIVASSAMVSSDEFELAGVSKIKSQKLSLPAVQEAPAYLECELFQTLDLPDNGGGENVLVIGSVVGIYINDNALIDGIFDFKPISRLGYRDYAIVNDKITLDRPDGKVS